MSNRMQVSMDYLINNDQKGFLPGRRISANIRKILDIMHHTTEKELEAIILSLDFQKCFDRISNTAILGSLEFFGFSPFIQKWVKILYTNFNVTVQNNGYFSKNIEVKRGVHQGGCCSVNLFLTIAEIIALTLREGREIQGIPVNEILYLLSQFADDMDMFLEANEANINRVFDKFEYLKEANRV